jgi:DNA-binding transcriptional MerR regulator
LVDKAPDAYRTISEVADDLDLPQHVLRFWETRFAQIRPLKRGGGRRYYRPEDIDLLKGIRHLLYGEGYTIRGVQRIIKESGVKAIQAIGRGEGAGSLPKPKGPDIIEPSDHQGEGAPPPASGLRASLKGLFRSGGSDALRPSPSLALESDAALPPLGGDSYGHRPFAATRQEPVLDLPPSDQGPFDRVREEAAAAPPAYPVPQAGTPSGHAGTNGHSTSNGHARQTEAEAPPAPVSRAAAVEPVKAAPTLTADDVRKLQAAIYELSECRKRLDQALGNR